jgi:conjugal transfer/type IV secretion protein DotA/TraY
MKTQLGFKKSSLWRMFLPGILPRVRDLFSNGFGGLAFIMAQLYRSVHLLPPNHPYLDYKNKGRYGIWNVISEARHNLILDWKHIDQIIIFISLFVGVILMIAQFLLFLASIVSADAHAFGSHVAGFFHNPDPSKDVAFMALDHIFGVPGIFQSEISQGAAGVFPTPFHSGLQALFEFYSFGLFIIVIMVIAYYVVTVVAETAVEGTPFGKRFNSLWAPVRIILVAALLIPIHYGMNIAQLTTLRVAKHGSNLATNAWINFNKTTNHAIAGYTERDALIAIPVPPRLNTFLELISVANVCRDMYKMDYGRDIDGYVIPSSGSGHEPALLLSGASFENASKLSKDYIIEIAFGEYDPAHTKHPGGIAPVCGKLSIKLINAPKYDGAGNSLDGGQKGSLHIQKTYYETVREEFYSPQQRDISGKIAARFTQSLHKDPLSEIPNLEYLRTSVVTSVEDRLAGAIAEARVLQIDYANWEAELNAEGWAAAGAWYNKLAEYNGTLFSATYNLPTPTQYPEIMEFTAQEREKGEEHLQPHDRFRPYRASNSQFNAGAPIAYNNSRDFYIAQALYYTHLQWRGTYVKPENNVFLDTVNLIFGTSGLFSMRANMEAGVHPMAALVAVGSSLIESTVMNMGTFALGGIMGGIGNQLSMTVVKNLGTAITQISTDLAMLGLSLGFVLYYVLPFMPFIYFFFAFAGWLKAVFEAMVGTPLWALAFLRLDGEGLFGQSAMNGVFIIMEIFLRPIIVVIALISSVIIFTGLIEALNSLWDLALANIAGDRPQAPTQRDLAFNELYGQGVALLRGKVDFVFYTAMYTIFVFLMAVNSFKMIDQVPNFFMRWLGEGIAAIGEGELSGKAGEILGQMHGGVNTITMQFNSGSQSIMDAILGRQGR